MEYNNEQITENEYLQKELVRVARKSRLKRKVISTLVVCVLVLLTVLTAWIYGRNQGRKVSEEEIVKLTDELVKKDAEIKELMENPIVVSPVAPEINLDIVYSEIENIGELATVEYLFTDASRFTDSKQIKGWNIPLTEKSFLLRWDGVIKAGVKIDHITIDVNQTDMKIEVTIPAAEILTYSIDYDSVEVLDEKDNIFNKITLDDRVKFDAANEKAMKERAIENGILEKAQKNAEDIIARLLTANEAIGTNYTITFAVQNS